MSKQQTKQKKKLTVGRVIGKIIKWFFLILLAIILIGAIAGVLMLKNAKEYVEAEIIPNAGLTLANFETAESTRMYYMDKASGDYKELATFYASENRTWVSYDKIPEAMINATVAIEDKRFWQHDGVDWKRTAAGVVSMFTGASIQGGSTLTQQLIKNVTDDDEVTVKRKILEIFRALELEKTYSKETILEYYLNYIYLGNGCYGVQAAAEYYFDKDVEDLDLVECACIISITNNPSMYDPYTEPEANKERRNEVLFQLYDQGYVSEAEYNMLLKESDKLEFEFSVVTEEQVSRMYSWYEEQVISDVIKDLMDTFGYSESAAYDVFYTGGLKIYTNLDKDVQATVEGIYSDTSNLPYISNSGQQMQSAITVIDVRTGNIVGIAGKLGEKEGNRVWNMASDTLRQPGSAFKPIGAYAPAINEGLLTPYSVVDDYAVMDLNGVAWPRNSHGGYSGMMLVSSAVTSSTNTVACQVINSILGVNKSVEYLEDHFHITSIEHGVEVDGDIYNDFGLGQLALGGLSKGVNTVEMAAAYAVFANNGLYNKPRTYSLITNSDDEVVIDNTPDTEVALEESTCYYMNQMLKNVISYGTGTEAYFSGMTIAGKTGTTDDNFDRYFVGYSPYYSAAVWTGYENSEYMRNPGMDNPAAVMWRRVMSALHENLEDIGFSDNVSTSSYSICLDCGKLATSACAMDIRQNRVGTYSFVEGTQPTESCSCHKVFKACTAKAITLPDISEELMEIINKFFPGLWPSANKPDTTPEGSTDSNDEQQKVSYTLAGPFCPEDSVKDVSAPVFARKYIAGASAADDAYSYDKVTTGGTCTVHNSGWTDSISKLIEDAQKKLEEEKKKAEEAEKQEQSSSETPSDIPSEVDPNPIEPNPGPEPVDPPAPSEESSAVG